MVDEDNILFRLPGVIAALRSWNMVQEISPDLK